MCVFFHSVIEGFTQIVWFFLFDFNENWDGR